MERSEDRMKTSKTLINTEKGKYKMNPATAKAIIKLTKVAYSVILRNLLKKAIDDPDEVWDDAVLKILDTLFGYEAKSEVGAGNKL